MKRNVIKVLLLSSPLLFATASAFISNPSSAQAMSTGNRIEVVQSNGTVLASGQFTTVEQEKETQGTVRIIEENDQRYLEFDAAFTTANGPDVEVVFHRDSVVPVNLDEADYVTLAQLQSFDGAQRYLIPAEMDLSIFNSVAIWCAEFNVTFGYAAL
jgi:multidrug efflux pump subunit AcrA (membrane-fusion protein)